MLDKNEFLQIVTKYDVNEVWVNFKDTFKQVRNHVDDHVYIYKVVTSMADRTLFVCEERLTTYFTQGQVPVKLYVEVVTSNSPNLFKFQAKQKELFCIYRKGEGLC